MGPAPVSMQEYKSVLAEAAKPGTLDLVKVSLALSGIELAPGATFKFLGYELHCKAGKGGALRVHYQKDKETGRQEDEKSRRSKWEERAKLRTRRETSGRVGRRGRETRAERAISQAAPAASLSLGCGDIDGTRSL